MIFKTKNLMLTHCYYLICSPYSNIVSCLTNTFCNCFQYFVFSCPKSSLIWKAPQLFFVFHEFDIFDVYRSITLKKYPSVWVCWMFPPDSSGLFIFVGLLSSGSFMSGGVWSSLSHLRGAGGFLFDLLVKVVCARFFHCKVAVSFCN